MLRVTTKALRDTKLHKSRIPTQPVPVKAPAVLV